MLFTNTNSQVSAIIKYKDTENKDITDVKVFPLKVYTREEALNLGLIQKDNKKLYFGLFIALIIIFIIYRKIKKNKKKEKSKNP